MSDIEVTPDEDLDEVDVLAQSLLDNLETDAWQRLSDYEDVAALMIKVLARASMMLVAVADRDPQELADEMDRSFDHVFLPIPGDTLLN